MTDEEMPTLHDVIAARPRVYQYLKPTPLYTYCGLSDMLDAKVWVKHENHLPCGAYKVRGAVNLAAHLSQKERDSGLFTASTGNHGQGVAYAARAHGLRATVAVPEGANPGKVATMRGLGAEVVFRGPNYESALEWATAAALEKGGRLVRATEGLVICGDGTYGLEIIEDLPEVDVIIIPIASGSGACATAIVAKAINPRIEIIAVQSAQAPAMQLSWAAGKTICVDAHSTTDALAVSVPFEDTLPMLRKLVDDFVLVDDSAIDDAVLLLLEHTHNLAEGAAAAPLAAALNMKGRLAGKNVVLVMTGGNLSFERLRILLARPRTQTTPA